MKKASLFLNIILIVAVGYLYMKVFSNSKEETKAPQEEKASSHTKRTKYAYINIDTLDAHFIMVEDMRKEIEDEKLRLQSQLKSKATQLEQDYIKLQEEARYMTQTQAMEKQSELVERQEKLMLLEQNLGEKLMQLESDKNQMLQKAVNDALLQINEDNTYDFVFGYNGWGNLLYAGDSLNITSEVLTILNDNYTNSKKEETNNPTN